MRCEKCIYCVCSNRESYYINCDIFGEEVREKVFCRYYTTEKELRQYEELKKKIDKGEEKNG